MSRCLYFLVCCCICQSVYSAKPSEEDAIWFENHVRPILSEHCQSCHSHEVGKTSGGLSLDSREDLLKGGDSGPAVELADPANSLILSAVRRESFEMPPEKPLPADQQAILEEWLRRGMPWPEYEIDPALPNAWLHQRAKQHWAWHIKLDRQPPTAQPVSSSLSTSDAIDSFIDAKLRELSIEPANQADAVTLFRRACVDLTGLPPTIEETRHFNKQLEAGTPLQVAFEEAIDRLLASEHFGVHWARHWLDLVRYSETMGHEFDYPIHEAWRYRDAVIQAINQDVPYDRFVTEHIAGDSVSNPRMDDKTGINASLALTGWWWFGDSVQAPVDIEVDHATRLDNQIDVLSKAFLGMTVACARCHDHKFDAISAVDYYGLSSILKSSRRVIVPTDPFNSIRDYDQEVGSKIQVTEVGLKSAHPWAETSDPSIEAQIDDLISQLQTRPKLIEALTSVGHPLAWMVPISQPDSIAAWSAFQSKVAQSAEEHELWRSQSELLADFRDGIPEGWKSFADNDDKSLATSQYDWLNHPIVVPRLNTIFSSDVHGKSQRLILQSPEFEITNNAISVLGKGNSANSTIHVAGYYMQEFHQLLFGDMRKSFSSNHLQWLSHRGDLNKYVGHRGHLSFEDQGDGWFSLQEIRVSDVPAPNAPHPATLEIAKLNANDRRQLTAKIANHIASLVNAAPQSLTQAQVDEILALNELAQTMQRPQFIRTNKPFQVLHAELQDLAKSRPLPTPLLTIQEGTPVDTHVAVRGNPNVKGEIAPRGCFRDILHHKVTPKSSSGRMELAEQMVHPEHPLTARVMVNRVWGKLFGAGIVSTPDNFGVLGGRPSHPELLDYLTQDFIEHDWSIKRLIKNIMLSSAYQRSSLPTSDQQTRDADGRWLSYRMPQRMTAESIRDALLQLSGSLDSSMYGPPVPVYLTAMMTGRGRPAESGPLDGNGRRTIFSEVRRNFLNPFLVAFDLPLPSTTVGQRARSNVPAQSLSLLNDPFVELMASRWVQSNVMSDKLVSQVEREDLMRRLFLQAYTRDAEAREVQTVLAWLEDHPDGASSPAAWQDLWMAVVNSKEFIYVR